MGYAIVDFDAVALGVRHKMFRGSPGMNIRFAVGR